CSMNWLRFLRGTSCVTPNGADCLGPTSSVKPDTSCYLPVSRFVRSSVTWLPRASPPAPQPKIPKFLRPNSRPPSTRSSPSPATDGPASTKDHHMSAHLEEEVSPVSGDDAW